MPYQVLWGINLYDYILIFLMDKTNYYRKRIIFLKSAESALLNEDGSIKKVANKKLLQMRIEVRIKKLSLKSVKHSCQKGKVKFIVKDQKQKK